MTYGSGGPGQFSISNFSGLRGRPAPEAFSAHRAVEALRRGIGGGLARRVGPDFLAELEALQGESDASAFAEALFSLAFRQEQNGRSDIAALLYQAITEEVFPASLQQRARQQLEAVLGRGSALNRAEHLGRFLAEEAADPMTLAAM